MGVDSEVGQLRTVLVHRPGPELQRMTPRHRERVLFGSLPWVSRARQEHDLLCQALRDQDVEVLYLTELLQDALEYQAARDAAIGLAAADAGLGDELRGQLRTHLEGLGPEALAGVLIAGLTPAELRTGHGVVYELLDRHDFVLDPLPNLVFTRDSSLWVGDRVAVASPAAGRRRREAGLASVIYRHHPRFAGLKWLYDADQEHLDGGDVLLLAPGVIAVGVGERTTPAGTERLASRLFDAGLATSVLAVPMSQQGPAGYLDTVCTVVGHDAVIMHPAVAYALTAHVITPRPDGMRVSRPQPFLQAAARAMGLERLRVIDTGSDSVGWRDQWDDGSNVLAIGPQLVIGHERNSDTNARLEEAGIRVIRVPSSELGSLRGGPRCMSCPVSREPLAVPAGKAGEAPDTASPRPLARQTMVLAGGDETAGQPPAWAEPQAPAAAAVPASRTYSEIEVPGHPARQPGEGADGGHAQEEELASASLGRRGLPAPPGRPAADPEYQAEAEDHQEQHQAEHEHPQEEVDDRADYPEDENRGRDQQQDAKHKYTVRAPSRNCQPGAGRSARRRAQLRARFDARAGAAAGVSGCQLCRRPPTLRAPGRCRDSGRPHTAIG
jgi:arginine deiminase